MIKHMTLLLGVAFLAGWCCAEDVLPIGHKSSYKTAVGTEYVSAGLIEKTWKTDPKVDGTWPMPKPVDTSMYKDATGLLLPVKSYEMLLYLFFVPLRITRYYHSEQVSQY